MQSDIHQFWSQKRLKNRLLWPVSVLYGAIAGARRLGYRHQLLRSERLPVPVVVIGNIYVGGTGKTPLVIHLVKALQQAGLKPGVVSRGYGRNDQETIRIVTPDDLPEQVGDEPLLISRQTGVPLAVGSDRVAAANYLLEREPCDLLLLDDGLQHYRMARDFEIAVVDYHRGHGNGWLLPAGPLREPISRLSLVDAVVYNGSHSPENGFVLTLGEMYGLNIPDRRCALDAYTGKTVHAVAGIGHPQRFFNMLEEKGVKVIPHPFPDHHQFEPVDLCFDDELPVLLTEKDAVKCRFSCSDETWVVPVTIEGNPSFNGMEKRLIETLAKQVNRDAN